MGEGGGLGSPLPPSTEPLLAPPEPGPTVPRPGLRPRHLSPLPRTRAHPPETARLASFQAPPVGHTSDQGVEGAVKAVGTVTPGLAAPEPRPGPAPDTASGLAGSPGTGLRRSRLGPAPSGAAPHPSFHKPRDTSKQFHMAGITYDQFQEPLKFTLDSPVWRSHSHHMAKVSFDPSVKVWPLITLPRIRGGGRHRTL